MAQWPPTAREAGPIRGGTPFRLVSDHAPTGDQPAAIDALVDSMAATGRVSDPARARRSPSPT